MGKRGRPKKTGKEEKVPREVSPALIVDPVFETLQQMGFSSDDLDLGEEVNQAIAMALASPVPAKEVAGEEIQIGSMIVSPGRTLIAPTPQPVVADAKTVEISSSMGEGSSQLRGKAEGKKEEVVKIVQREETSKAGGEKQGDRRLWSEVAKGEANLIFDQKLEYIPPGPEGVTITDEDYARGNRLWQNALVGYVLGIKPGYRAMVKYAQMVWKTEVPPKIYQLQEGVFLFRFSSEQDKAKVLASRWSFSRAPFILQQWNPKMNLNAIKPDKVAVWVRLSMADIQFWDTTILSKLASYIGRPLQADLMTATIGRLSFARVLVEVEVNSKLPDAVPFNTSSGGDSVPVVYEWYPSECPKCGRWGHKEMLCPKKPGEDRIEEKTRGREEKQEDPMVQPKEPVGEDSELTEEGENGQIINESEACEGAQTLDSGQMQETEHRVEDKEEQSIEVSNTLLKPNG